MDTDLTLGTINMDYNDLTIMGRGTLTLNGYGSLILKAKVLKIDGATVHACQNSTDLKSSIFYVRDSFECKNGSITIEDKSKEAEGIETQYGDIILEDSILDIRSSGTSIYANGDLTCRNGSITIENENEKSTADGIYSAYGDAVIENSSLDITTNWEGVYGGRSLTIDNCNTIIRCGGEGLDSGGDLTIKDSTLDIQSQYTGMEASSAITIKDSSVRIDSDRIGIKNETKDEKMEFSNSDILVTAKEDGLHSYGDIIFTSSELDISAFPAIGSLYGTIFYTDDIYLKVPADVKYGKFSAFDCAILKGDDYPAYHCVIAKKRVSDDICTISDIAVQTYTGKALMPAVTVSWGGTALRRGTDYILDYNNNIKAGMASVTISGNDNYTGEVTKTFKINKAANPLKIKAKTATVKYSKLKKKNQTLTVSKVIVFTKKGQGKLTYKKVSGDKKITINKSTGKVTVKKGLKKGTYKVKAAVKATGNANYKASALKKVTLKIIVK